LFNQKLFPVDVRFTVDESESSYSNRN